jgi:hypothetical protein
LRFKGIFIVELKSFIMIDALQAEFALWKQAKQTREFCEVEEAKLRRTKNVWLLISTVILTTFLLARISIPGAGSKILDFGFLMNHPYVKYAILGVAFIIFAITCFLWLKSISARSKTDQARRNEWKVLLHVNKRYYQKTA